MSSHPTSIWRRSSSQLRQNEIWLECFCVVGLFCGALILFAINLGNLSLIDWNEAIVAQVAKEITQAKTGSGAWIWPTLWNKPYLANPPLIHNLVAIAYTLGGINELTTRLPGAILGAISVCLLYNVGREIFVARTPALLSALIYLTCLPVVRLGRLAMLDGPLLCFEILAIWAILRSRRDLRWALIAGMGLGLIGLTKGILGLPLVAIAIIFLLWDTPRLISSIYLWAGIGLGIIPLIGWYFLQWYRYQELSVGIESLGFWAELTQLPDSKEMRSLLEYLCMGLEHSVPWLIVMVGGFKLALDNLHWGWGKLLVVWGGVYLVTILFIADRQYWYILPLYPALALAAGARLNLIHNLPSYVNYPRPWTISFLLMAVLTGFTGLYFVISHYVDVYLPLIFGSLTLTLVTTAVLLARRERLFMTVLFWGFYVSFLLLFLSPHWIWELKTVEPVKPIAELIHHYIAEDEVQVIYTSGDRQRPALDFYSNHRIIPKTTAELKQIWQQDSPACLLLDRRTIERLDFIPPQAIFEASGSPSLEWVLAIKNTEKE